MAMEDKINFENVCQSDFYPTLKERVNNYFKQNGITEI